ncbi:MAG: hypothetical protein UY81_C0041G0007 [Candidatus Giovannonibacteria bacterium GW2011_GWA2_53_7]|uniref:Uncharacterized protein n=1 Tax=Candidatus Giovannonibacteria bacterium GW2011_GWA2_53_7 TaxID=1618650 RepID=A0A0G1XWT7_9BACT|nr:MAG: hypothetical protein UY81_C0041G0007 [Candidatus Giovannonibacteria bacterium GW2011_GWA2_53_7]
MSANTLCGQLGKPCGIVHFSFTIKSDEAENGKLTWNPNFSSNYDAWDVRYVLSGFTHFIHTYINYT